MQDIRGIVSASAGVSGAVASWLDFVNTIVQIGAGILGAIASAYTIYYFWKKGRSTNK